MPYKILHDCSYTISTIHKLSMPLPCRHFFFLPFFFQLQTTKIKYLEKKSNELLLWNHNIAW